MFALYTTYIGENLELGRKHILEMVESLKTAAKFESEEEAAAYIQAFVYFHHPKLPHSGMTNFKINLKISGLCLNRI